MLRIRTTIPKIILVIENKKAMNNNNSNSKNIYNKLGFKVKSFASFHRGGLGGPRDVQGRWRA